MGTVRFCQQNNVDYEYGARTDGDDRWGRYDFVNKTMKATDITGPLSVHNNTDGGNQK